MTGSSIGVIAAGALSSLGRGANAYAVGAAGEAPRCAVGLDPELSEHGLTRPRAARLPSPVRDGELETSAALLNAAARDLAVELDSVRPGFRSERVAVVLGTSSAGLFAQRGAFRSLAAAQAIERGVARAAPYFAPAREVEARLGIRAVRVVQVLAACASSTLALGIGLRYLELDHCDLVIAGGYDAVDPLVAAGFEVLGATTATVPRPFRVERDGLALGEGAALVALARTSSPCLGRVLGFAATSDAHHVTAPDPSGKGLAAAALRALADAEVSAGSIDLVSAHGTATTYNDTAEARALERALGPTDAVVHAFKGSIGHTLGAGGVLETLAALDAMQRGVTPASFGGGTAIPELLARLPARNERGSARHALKLSAAFGGVNAALVLARSDVEHERSRRLGRPVTV
ncbi:MAG TPA: beta-ketoacyl synthase N-terminal-like domain-containing protein, partial [Polyangiaceae bacterium]